MNDYSVSSSGMQTFVPNSLAQAAAGGVYYIALLLIVIISIFTIYNLVKYADSKGTAFIASIIYAIIFLSVAVSGMHTLTLIH